jgi:hypothetical protein
MRNFTDRVKRVSGRIRTQGLFPVLRNYSKSWLRIIPFYYMKEVVTSDIPAHLTVIPEGFEFSLFDREDVTVISKLEERKGYTREQYVLECLGLGDTCLGLKQNGEVAAFNWCSLEKCHSFLYPTTMKENEAYLYDMYVLKSFRGSNLAPILRYKTYEILRALGRDTFYSITVCSNVPSFRFKQKLGAKVIFLGLCIIFLNKHRLHWVLKRYKSRDFPSQPPEFAVS